MEQIDIFLQPGEAYFGDAETRIRTLLGSCVAITWWHPQRCLGAMCHYLLPRRSPHHIKTQSHLDGRYAEEAFALVMGYIQAAGTQPSEYVVKMFGGGQMLKDEQDLLPAVGARNIEFGKQWLASNGFTILSEDLAGKGHRNIVFDVATGDVWVRFRAPKLHAANAKNTTR